jgi:hypothetical protein
MICLLVELQIQTIMALQTKKKVLASFFLSDMKMCACHVKKDMIVIILWYNYYCYFYQNAAYGIAVLAWMDVNA